MEEHPFVRVARDAIRHYSLSRTPLRPDAAPGDPPPSGVFVSLHEAPGPGETEGPLRGCIGSYEPHEANLRTEIARSAVAAAYSDPRFAPLRPDEIDGLQITVYLLGPPELIGDRSLLDPSRYGIIIEGMGRRGLLLPAIPGIETVEQQISIAMRKAGLADGDDLAIYRFEAEILH